MQIMNAMRDTDRIGRNEFRWLVLAAIAYLAVSGAARAATIVTNHVISQTRQPQTAFPVTFGQVFKAGTVARGETLSATVNEQAVPLQVDAKATNADGSLRHA
ncbi:MAG: hypothetical protein ABI178_12370, partial [Rhodanobacter sp.]